MVGVLAKNKAWRAIRIGEKLYHAKNKLTKELKAKIAYIGNCTFILCTISIMYHLIYATFFIMYI